MDADALTAARDALARHDWQAARDAAAAASVDTRMLEAERADLLAEAEWWLGRLDACIEAREQAYRLYDELGEHRQAGQCAVWLWEHYAITARPANAGAWLRRARRSLEGDTECAAYGALLLREAETAHGSGDLERAAVLATDVIALARDLRSPDLEAEALQTKGRVLIDQGDVAEGMGHLDEAMLFAIEGRLGPFSTGKVYCSLISACEDVGDYDRAAEWTEATLKWADRHPFAIWPGICRVHRGRRVEAARRPRRGGTRSDAGVRGARAQSRGEQRGRVRGGGRHPAPAGPARRVGGGVRARPGDQWPGVRAARVCCASRSAGSTRRAPS